MFSARLWELQSVGISNALTPCLLRAAGIAKTLTQVSYLSAVTSLADRGNLKNTDVPRSLFCKMVLIDINDISPLQTFIDQNRPQPLHSQHRLVSAGLAGTSCLLHGGTGMAPALGPQGKSQGPAGAN